MIYRLQHSRIRGCTYERKYSVHLIFRASALNVEIFQMAELRAQSYRIHVGLRMLHEALDVPDTFVSVGEPDSMLTGGPGIGGDKGAHRRSTRLGGQDENTLPKHLYVVSPKGCEVGSVSRVIRAGNWA